MVFRRRIPHLGAEEISYTTGGFIEMGTQLNEIWKVLLNRVWTVALSMSPTHRQIVVHKRKNRAEARPAG